MNIFNNSYNYNPGVKHYESWQNKAGAHLLFNAFWRIPHFCVNLMSMRDPMHQIENGIVISFLKAILRKYSECLELILPDKVARFLYEYHDFRFCRLDLPLISDDRSEFEVHAALITAQVGKILKIIYFRYLIVCIICS